MPSRPRTMPPSNPAPSPSEPHLERTGAQSGEAGSEADGARRVGRAAQATAWGILVALLSLVIGCSANASSPSSPASQPPSADGQEEVQRAAPPEEAVDASAPARDGGGAPNEPEPCIDDPSPGFHRYRCERHTFDVQVPTSCPADGCGLIVDVHGFSMSGEMEEKNTGMRARGGANGYLVIQPTANGPPTSWDPTGGDDGDVKAFIDRVLGSFSIDRKRVHMMGFSQGGMMTWRFLCRWPGLFASVAPGAAPARSTGDFGKGQPCPAGVPTPTSVDILELVGRFDGFFTFDSAIADRDAWLRDLAATNTETVPMGAGAERTRYSGNHGVVFDFLVHDYRATEACVSPLGGHCFPGSSDFELTLPGQFCAFGCGGPTAFHWGETALTFFRDHPKR